MIRTFCTHALALALFVTPQTAASTAEYQRVLYVYSLPDYFSRSVLERFETEYNCRVEIDYFETFDIMFEAAKNHNAGFDVIVTSTSVAEQLYRADVLTQLDHNRIPNLRHIKSRLLRMFPDEEMRYHIPYTIAAVGIAYNKTMITPEKSGTWSLFAREGYEKRAAMLGDMRYAMGAALKHLGYSVNTTHACQIAAAARMLRSWKPNIAMFSTMEAREMLLQGELAFIQTFHGSLVPMMRQNPDLAFFMPEEGSIVVSESFVIPRDAEDSDLAYKFINFLISPPNAAESMEAGLRYMPNPAARKLMDPCLEEDTNFKVPLETILKCESVRHIDELQERYDEAWMEVLMAK